MCRRELEMSAPKAERARQEGEKGGGNMSHPKPALSSLYKRGKKKKREEKGKGKGNEGK